MGGVIALALASGWFGISVSSVLAFGIKVSWSDDELAKALAVSQRPPKEFEQRLEAAQRFLLLAGLGDLAEPTDPIVEAGISELPGGRVRVAADPRAAGIGAPSMDSLMEALQAPVRLACGSEDALVGVDELRAFDAGAEEWPGVGHNAQVEAPVAVWSAFERCSPIPLRPWGG
jgi:pimeloyl-ACP methyl ester carboxylesterase